MVSRRSLSRPTTACVRPKLLIEARCNIDLQDKDGATPLHAAAHQMHAAIMEQLIEARCNVDLQRENGYTPLCMAPTRGMLQSRSCSCSAL